ncbi:MAG: dicarboxylate/amino acid:cation symporter, partial [Acidobacteriota bacterium]
MSTPASASSTEKAPMALHNKILIGMLIGVVLGLLVGPNAALLPQTGVELRGAVLRSAPDADAIPIALGQSARRARVLETSASTDADAPEWLRVRWTVSAQDLLRLRNAGVEEAARAKPGTALEGWVLEEPAKVTRYAPIGQTLVDATEWIGRLFIALIKMVVVPLIFFSLVVGVASLGDFRKLGRIGGRTVLFFTGTTMVALVIGVGLTNLVRPGNLVAPDDRAMMLAAYEDSAGGKVASAAEAPGLVDQLIGMVPSNPFAALAQGEMLQVITFALLLGIALTLIETARAQMVVDLFDRLNDAMVMLVHIAMALAPYGVAALLFKVVGTTGLSVLVALSAYGLVVVVGLLLHLFITYGSVIRFGIRLPFTAFLDALKEALLVAFSTSSSSATLPITKSCCEENLNVSPQTTSFVLPIGATVNMDGTALYQGVAAIFIAQIYGL